MTVTPPAVLSELDPFTDEALTNPYPAYDKLREQGPAAYLAKYDLWVYTRYDLVRSALEDWATYSSGAGIGLNDGFNQTWSAALIHLDPPAHSEQRPLFTSRLSPRALKPVAESIDRRAGELADRLLAKGSFDAMPDLAQDLPVHLIMDLIGWPEEGRDELLAMAEGWFNTGGPDNERMRSALPKVGQMIEFLQRTVAARNLREGGFGWDLLEAHAAGQIPVEAAVGLLAGYIVAAFDTTINAIGNGTWLFATHPDQWDAVRADPSLIPGAVNEIVRLESPVQALSRITTRDVDLGEGVVVPAGARVVMAYAAANRDPRHYPDPAVFDVRRNPVDHLGFGYGVHGCAGQGLARMEAQAVFTALARRVRRIEVDGEPVRMINNILLVTPSVVLGQLRTEGVDARPDAAPHRPGGSEQPGRPREVRTGRSDPGQRLDHQGSPDRVPEPALQTQRGQRPRARLDRLAAGPFVEGTRPQRVGAAEVLPARLAQRERVPGGRSRRLVVTGQGQRDRQLEECVQHPCRVAHPVEGVDRPTVVGDRLAQPAGEQRGGAGLARGLGGRGGVAEVLGEIGAAAQPFGGGIPVALQQSHPGSHPQRLSPGPAGAGKLRQGEGGVQPATPVREEAVGAPVPAQGGSHRQGHLDRGRPGVR